MSRNRKRLAPSPAASENAPACGICSFWVQTDPGVGECRRYPPVARFPIIGAAMWCGEFQENATPPAPEPTL